MIRCNAVSKQDGTRWLIIHGMEDRTVSYIPLDPMFRDVNCLPFEDHVRREIEQMGPKC